ncbi:hypothetical protein ASPZODRAFT_126673 [Penicilliopsis zonata CBS 506.65]|uniref:NADH:flavin oxidoreductase/NADH oxidase N-terminal domain-containing protein n=1 Tax=Penicilliopsis zonata CBS 506.65 TaxID=1073090 RepID=A0A1L9SU78_9EURO|nr:hypothetical protein ASPZODRAFT_126673 [Penicilliopsis zonata CBS 506.65]OJJ50749.1 hypothetical protein ASPZODRAFT_126673 [Penicilliopsis zonata CBS 506.65]
MTVAFPDIENKPAAGISYFTPAQEPPSSTAASPQTSGAAIPKLFQPITIRGVTFPNRIGLAPLCQYSAEDGHMTDWHMAHLGGIAMRGAGFIMAEATAVVPEGRITPQDTGLWKDSQIEPMRRVFEFAHSQGQVIGVQLGHAGRKASTVAPWLASQGNLATPAVGGWPDNVKGPSAVPFASNFATPKAMTLQEIDELKTAWVAAVQRALKAGADFIEIHNAHGYLLSSFLTPAVNTRTDRYGGSFENRIRLSLEIAQLTRDTVGPDVPVFLRVSATDWCEESLPDTPGWRTEDTVRFALALADQGAIDLLDVSTGGIAAEQKITSSVAFQIPFAVAVKQAVGDRLLISGVGALNDGRVANKVVEEDGLDFALVGRKFQRDPGLVWGYATDLGVEISVANQIRWPFTRRGGTPFVRTEDFKAAMFVE